MEKRSAGEGLEQRLELSLLYDAIKRASRQLRGYEGKLGLAGRFEKQKSMVQELSQEVQGLQMPGEEKKWEKVFRILENILEES